MDEVENENGAQLSQSDDSEFEDALEELLSASTNDERTHIHHTDQSEDSQTQLRERELAKTIVDDVISSAKKITLSSNAEDNSRTLQDTHYLENKLNPSTEENVLEDDQKLLEGNAVVSDSGVCLDKDSDVEADQQKGKEESEEDDDGVDEELLLERESKLTDDEKQDLKNRAQMLKTEGNNLFKEDNFIGAISSYTDALRMCPLCFAKERSIMYSNRAACKLHLDQTEAAIEDCSKALEINANYMKCLLRRAELYEKTDKLDEALADYQKALEMDPGIHQAREACMRLPDQIKERNEKLKEEMIGKLKDLGNLVLRPFGLSTNNFQLNQDPNTGGYSVSFQQNPNQP